jgi:hypothetical protein
VLERSRVLIDKLGAGGSYGEAADRRRDRASNESPAACACSQIFGGDWPAESDRKFAVDFLPGVAARSGPGGCGIDGHRSYPCAVNEGRVNPTSCVFPRARAERARALEGTDRQARRRRQLRGRCGSTARSREQYRSLKGDCCITFSKPSRTSPFPKNVYALAVGLCKDSMITQSNIPSNSDFWRPFNI